MPVNLPNFLSVEPRGYGVPTDLISHAIEGYKASRLPKQIRQEEQQRDLYNALLGHQGYEAQTKNKYLNRQLEQGLRKGEADIGYTQAGTGLLGQQTETARIVNRLKRLHGEREMLAGIHSTEAITKGHKIQNEIEQETGLLKAYLDMQNKNLTNKGLIQQQEWYPLNQGINALEGLGRVRKGDFEQDVAEQFDIPQRKSEQTRRELENKAALHNLQIQQEHDRELLKLRIAKERGEITGQEHDNAIKKVNAQYAPLLAPIGVQQAQENVAATRAGISGTEAGTIGQEIKNQIEQRHADNREKLAQDYSKGLINANELSNRAKEVDNEYQRDFKELEKKLNQENISAVKAGTKSVMADVQAKNFANKLNGEYGKHERQLAIAQANEGAKQTALQNVKLSKDIQEQMKYGDDIKAAELQTQKDASQLAQAKIFEAMAEANKHNKAYENVPEGSVPISEFQRTAQNSIIKEQEQMAIRIENAEEAVRVLDKMEKIVDEYPDFGKDWRIALTVNDKPGVIKNLINTLAPGQNQKKKAAAEQFLKYSQDLVLKLGPAALGARFTDAKYRGMQSAKPFVHNTAEANKAVIGHMKKELEPLKKYKKDFQKARYKYTLPFDWEKYSDIPIDQLSDKEFESLEMAEGLK